MSPPIEGEVTQIHMAEQPDGKVNVTIWRAKPGETAIPVTTSYASWYIAIREQGWVK